MRIHRHGADGDLCLMEGIHDTGLAHPHMEVLGLYGPLREFTARQYCFGCGVDVGDLIAHDASLDGQEELADQNAAALIKLFFRRHLPAFHRADLVLYGENPEVRRMEQGWE